MSTTPFTPITKESAAQILSVSVRTIDHYVADGRMPAPVHLGRRAYWHPDAFYGWLHRALGALGADESKEEAQRGAPPPGESVMLAAPHRPTDGSPKRTKSGRNAQGARSPLGARVQNRDAALLAALNGRADDEEAVH
ncbi:helix-turn-helix transcriptional regulator [Paraburkholderia sp. BR10937]|uniref:helix-turn-helix transcriptional regulator n=1 Tax=Paraburkholderia sp. BR10937 TaxID=3236994 RepID=UPI0034D28150